MPPKRKRGSKSEIIDLVESNVENEGRSRSPKQTRRDDIQSPPQQRDYLQPVPANTAHPGRPSNGATTHQSGNQFDGLPSLDRDSWQASSLTQAGMTSELIDDDDPDDDIDGRNFRLYGTMQATVVGVRFYRGIATQGELVRLKREPGNPYDSNAIRIDNVADTQVGHMKRQQAAKLAPFIDDGSIIIQATLASQLGHLDGPLEVKLYGTSDPQALEVLKGRLKDAKLPVNDLTREDRERKQREKERKAQEKVAERQRQQQRKQQLQQAAQNATNIRGQTSLDADEQNEASEYTNSAAPWKDQEQDANAPDMETILDGATSFDPRELGSVADKYGPGEENLSKLPMADQPKGLLTALLPYQRQGLAWMLDRENPKLPAQGETTQLWKCKSKGRYMNLATNHTTTEPKFASGGILADDMGLGKTLQIIALMIADPKRKETGQPTLVICPLSVMSNWSNQAMTHVHQGHSMRVMIYHGQNKQKQKPDEFAKYDLVVTTYHTMALEWAPTHSKPGHIPRPNGLFSVDWRRVVLDEGHHIRNPKSKMAQAAYALLGRSRWVLTGTPIVNTLRDLQSHVKFIRLTGGLEDPSIFSNQLIRPLNQGSSDANVLLQALMATLCLRRMKDMKFIDLRLPELSSHKYTIQFLDEERAKYDAFESEAKGVLATYKTKQQKPGQNQVNAYSHLLEVLLRMRQACNHWKLCGEDRVSNLMSIIEKEQKVKLTPDNVQALQQMLQLNIDSHEECCICMDSLHEPVITPCAHTFGFACIERVIESQQKCPMCRAPLADIKELVRPAIEGGETKTASFDTNVSSSKIQALLDILRATRKKDPKVKTVVFSQWTSFLDVIQTQIEAADFKFTRLDGKMNAAQRDEAMEKLAEDPECTILLASYGVCSVGLNLVAANQAILTDSWWSPAIEDQAVDRIYRLGQKKPVTVFRLIMEDSIEDRVIELQQKKRKLMMTAFGEKTMKRGLEKAARLADIERLLG